jgi:iron-sulfur cluster assembly protein
MSQNEVVNLTQKAKEELVRLSKQETKSPDGVRISLLAGGCSGLSYNLEFDKLKENDVIADHGDIKILIDPKSALYIYGITLDFQGGLTGKGFTFDNPNAKKSCGCGTSFSVDDKDVTLEFKKNTNPNICPSESKPAS